MQYWFDERQDVLRRSGCFDSDIAAITTMNKIQRVVSQCRNHHCGPLTSKEELAEMAEKVVDPKKLSKLLDLEIRHRKFIMTNVKSNCPLFQKRKLSKEQKMENIGLLMDSHELGLKALTTMDELVTAINVNEDVDENLNGKPVNENQESSVESETAAAPVETSECHAQQILSKRLSPNDNLQKDEFILGMFEDGFYPGQMISDCGDKVDTIFMNEASFLGSAKSTFWKWTSNTDRHLIRKICVLKNRSNIDIAIEVSTRRCIVYKLMNLEIVEKFVL